MWLIFALLSAVFAAATSILAKIGIEGVNSPGNRHQNSGRCRDGMGDGVFDECAGRHCTDWKKELDFSNIIRTCDRRVMAVLLSGATAWRSFEGRAD